MTLLGGDRPRTAVLERADRVGDEVSAVILIPMPGDLGADAVLPAVLRHVGRRRATSAAVERLLAEAASERARGTSPEAVDALLYQLLAGVPEQLLREVAHEWYGWYRRRYDPMPPGPAVHEAPVVIVSDAPESSLAALTAEHRDVHVLGGRPVVDDCGVLTGVNSAPMVGAARRERVERLLGSLGVDPRRCVAYGRSSADVPLLELVGTPVVVGDNDHLLALAARSGWTVVGRGAPANGTAAAA